MNQATDKDVVWRMLAECLERTPSDRAAFLTEACANYPDVRLRVERLLVNQASVGAFLESPLVGSMADDEPDSLPEGTVVDKYRILRRLGRGGMGEVYLAERIQDYDETVALKIIRSDRTTPELLDAFRQERQILADLKSEQVTKIKDAGAHTDGRLFQIIEFVEGLPIHEYCAAKKLSRRQILDLFLVVAETIGKAHKHTTRIVHADIKPSHLLVTAEGKVKIIDFGIAVRGDPLSLMPRFVTPDFGSPEQLEGKPATERSDVYSLGKVCKSLIAKVTLTSYLDRLTVPEIDGIVNTALKEDPQQRYETAAEVADEIRRHLTGKHVRAHHGNWPFRSAKFVLRRPVLAGVTAAVFLVGAPVGWIWLQASREATIQRMAENAVSLLDTDPREALRLAYEVTTTDDSRLAVSALRRAVGNDLQQVVRARGGEVQALAFSANGQLLATISETGQLELWRVPTGEPVWSKHVPVGDFVELKFSSNDRLLELSESGDLWFVDIERPELLLRVGAWSWDDRTFSPSGAWEIHWDSDARLMQLYPYGSSRGGNTRPAYLAKASRPASAVAFTRDESQVAVSVGNQIQLYNIPAAKMLAAAAVGTKQVTALSFQGNGYQLFAGLSDGELRLWRDELASLSVARPHKSAILLLAPSSDARLILSAAADGGVAVSSVEDQVSVIRVSPSQAGVEPTWLALSQDAAVAAIGSRDGRVGVWNWRQTNRPRWYHVHAGRILRGSISDRGDWIATQSDDGTVRIWNSRSGATESWKQWRRPDRGQGTVSYANDDPTSLQGVYVSGPTTSTGKAFGVAEIYEVGRRQPVGRFAEVSSASLSSDGSLVAVVRSSGELGLWDMTKGQWSAVVKPSPPATRFTRACFLPSRHVVLATDDLPHAALWDADTGNHLAFLGQVDRSNPVACGDDPRFIPVALPTEIRVWDAVTGQQVFRKTVSSYGKRRVTVNSKTGLVAAADSHGLVRLWKIRVPSRQLQGRANGGIASVASDRKGRYLATTAPLESVIWDLSSLGPLLRLPIIGDTTLRLEAKSFDSTGTKVLLTPDGYSLAIWDLQTRTLVAKCCRHTALIDQAIFSPDGRFVITRAANGEVIAWRFGPGETLRKFRTRGAVKRLSVSPNSNIAMDMDDGSVELYDLDDDTAQLVILEPLVKSGRWLSVGPLLFSPVGGSWALARSDESNLFSLVVTNGANSPTIVHQQGRPFGELAFSPSGRMLASGSYRTLQVWNVNGAEVATIQENNTSFTELTFADNEQFIIATAFVHEVVRRTVAVWDLEVRTRVLDVPGHQAVMTPDGSSLVVASEGVVQVYATPELSVSLEALREQAKVKLAQTPAAQ